MTKGAQNIGHSSFPCEVKGSTRAFLALLKARGCSFSCTKVFQIQGLVTLSFLWCHYTVKPGPRMCCQYTQPSCQSRTMGSSSEDCFSSEARTWGLYVGKDSSLGNQTLSPNLAPVALYTWPNIWTESWQTTKEFIN